MPIIIGDFSYIPSEGKIIGNLKEGSYIIVSKLNDQIETSDLPRIRAELERRFPSIDYGLVFPLQVSSAGVGSVKVFVGYTQEARLKRTHSVGKPLPVPLSDMIAHLQ